MTITSLLCTRPGFLCTVPWASTMSGNWLLAAYLPAQIKVSLPKLSFTKAQTSPRCLTHVGLYKFLRFLTLSCISYPRTSITVCLANQSVSTILGTTHWKKLKFRTPGHQAGPQSPVSLPRTCPRGSSIRHTVRAFIFFSFPSPSQAWQLLPNYFFFLSTS